MTTHSSVEFIDMLIERVGQAEAKHAVQEEAGKIYSLEEMLAKVNNQRIDDVMTKIEKAIQQGRNVISVVPADMPVHDIREFTRKGYRVYALCCEGETREYQVCWHDYTFNPVHPFSKKEL